jgi:hypothetical protein
MINFNKILNLAIIGTNNAKHFFSFILGNIIIKIYILICIIVNIVNWLAASYIFTEVDKEFIPLHYNVDFGINYIARSQYIYIIPLFGLIIILANLFILAILRGHKNKMYIIHLLLLTAIMSNIFLFSSIISIYLINFI